MLTITFDALGEDNDRVVSNGAFLPIGRVFHKRQQLPVARKSFGLMRLKAVQEVLEEEVVFGLDEVLMCRGSATSNISYGDNALNKPILNMQGIAEALRKYYYSNGEIFDGISVAPSPFQL